MEFENEWKGSITPEQEKSYDRICARYEMQPISAQKGWDDVLMLNFGFIWIGIEKDGYAHS